MTFPWGRRLFPFVWYGEACVLGGAAWALLAGGRPRDAFAAAAYFALCGAAVTLPGPVILWLSARAGLSAKWRQRLLLFYLAGAAAAVAALLGTGRGWSAAVAILLTGNAIWAIETTARRSARAGSQPPAGK